MLVSVASTLLVLLATCRNIEAYTWPDPKVDLLEQILYQQNGYQQFGLVFGVFPCDSDINALSTGRTDSAEWFRTAYHDMATANVFEGTGGIDASIGFETERPENVGKFINETLGFINAFQSPTTSMADIIALATTITIGVCSNGSVIIPYSGGRIDATEAGPPGVPQPQDPLETHIADFARQGFNDTEMIGLVACGHTLGGVHGVDFPTIVPVLNDSNNQDSRVNFDASVANFDNSVAVQFVHNNTQNPLAFGHNVTTRSDHRIFTSDGGVLIKKMAQSIDYFFDTCTTLLERMLNTVPKTVTLFPVTAIKVKPQNVYLAVNKNGTFSFSGSVRLMEGEIVSATDPPSVTIHYVPRNGKTCTNCTVSTTTSDDMRSNSTYPNTPSFRSYEWSTTINGTAGISGFHVVVDHGKGSTTYGNGAAPFPVEDSLIVEVEKSCNTLIFGTAEFGYAYNVTASILKSASLKDVNLIVGKALPQQGSLSLAFEPETVRMTVGSAIGKTGYTTYTASFSYMSGSDSIALVTAGVTATTSSGETIGDPNFLGENFPNC